MKSLTLYDIVKWYGATHIRIDTYEVLRGVLISANLVAGKKMKEEIILGLIKTCKDVGQKSLDWVKTEEGKQFFCGTYTDGSTRSFRDAWNDEVMSPKSRKKRMKEIEKRRKLYEEMVLGKPKKKKKHKKKKKKSKKGNDFPHIDFTAF